MGYYVTVEPNVKYYVEDISPEGNKTILCAECMWGLLEEHLNYISHINLADSEPEDL